MTDNNSTITTEKFEQLFGFIEANTPIPAATLGVFSRELKSLANAFINEAAGNFTALPPTKVRKYRGLLMDRLEELSFYHYEEVAEAWMALRTLEDVTEEIVQLNNTFIEAMADKGYCIYKADDIGEVRHTKVVNTLKVTDLLYEWIEELEEFIEGHYQFVRKTQFFGRSEEEYISEKLYRDYEEVCFSKLQKGPEAALNEIKFDQLQQWFGHLKIDIRNFQSEIDANHNYQTSELVIPYFRQLVKLLKESLQVWKRWDLKGNPPSSGIFQNEDLQYHLRSETLKKEIIDYILKELNNFQERLSADIQYYEAHPYLLDINDPSCLSETQRLFFEFEKDPSLHEKYLAFPEILLDELVEELGLSYTFLEIKIPIVLDKERWTEEDKKDESIAYDYLCRMWWFEDYEAYPEEL